MHSDFYRPPTDLFKPALASKKSLGGDCKKKETRPMAIALIDVKEQRYTKARSGKILIKKDDLFGDEDELFGDKFNHVTILGEYGALYRYNDGTVRFSEGGLHYLIQKSEGIIKVPAAKIILTS